jgi:predicted XRE-type DNA-binding protein
MSRNPFLDLGFPPEEAAALHIRSQLAATLEYHIERKGWSQAEAARALKVPHPTSVRSSTAISKSCRLSS